MARVYPCWLWGRVHSHGSKAMNPRLRGGLAPAFSGKAEVEHRMQSVGVEPSLMENHLMLRLQTLASFVVVTAVACTGGHLLGEGRSGLESPDVEDGPSLTNEASVLVRGTAEAGASVRIEGGLAVTQTVADEMGAFEAEVPLRPNRVQTLEVRQDLGAGASAPALVTVEHDDIAPELMVRWPASPTSSDVIEVTGWTEPGATVAVVVDADRMLLSSADADGVFELSSDLGPSMEAMFDLEAWAVDGAGNVSARADFAFHFDPSVALTPPTLDAPAAPVADPVIALEGTADAEVDVVVHGPRGEARVRTGSDGVFVAGVELSPNAASFIRAHAEDPVSGDISASISVLLFHDDIAPSAPRLDPLPSSTSSPTVHVSGEAEAGATVVLDGSAGGATTRVSADGRFAADIALAMDDTTTIDTFVVDVAGNVGPPVESSVRFDADRGAIAIDPTERYTSDPSVELRGSSDADGTITVSGGDAPATARVDGSGRFAVDVDLREGARNVLHLESSAGGEAFVSITHDATAPVLDLDPLPHHTPDVLRLTGTAEPYARIEVDVDGMVHSFFAGDTGAFDARIDVDADASIHVVIRAIDRAGNASEPSAHDFEPSDNPMNGPDVPACPSSVSDQTIRLAGSADASVGIEIEGGARLATGAADASGHFDLAVELKANVVNELMITAVSGTERSAPTRCTVEHDDTPPDAPSCGFEIFGVLSADLSLCLLRTDVDFDASACVEGYAMVRVENLATRAVTLVRADATGSIRGSLAMCGGDSIALTAIDAAGNASLETIIER